MRILIALLSAFLLISFNNVVFAENFYLDSGHNKETLRFELDYDTVWMTYFYNVIVFVPNIDASNDMECRCY